MSFSPITPGIRDMNSADYLVSDNANFFCNRSNFFIHLKNNIIQIIIKYEKFAETNICL